MTHKESRQRWVECREYKAKGHTNKEVAEHFGIAYGTAKDICRGIAPQTATRSGNNQYKKYTEEDNRAYVESFLPIGFSYVGGYINCEHKVTIRCKVCGLEFERSMVSIRHGRITTCPVCAENENLIKAEEKEREVQRIKQEKGEQAAKKRRDKEAEDFLKTRLVQCEICGKVFSTKRSRKVCCSPECSKKRNNLISSHRKDSRIAREKRIDTGITATALYTAENGICWICGRQCDLNDYIVRDGTIICGDNYPSVDHVIPICEGGTDSWDNVRLAHRYCNSARYWTKKKKYSPPKNFLTTAPGDRCVGVEKKK